MLLWLRKSEGGGKVMKRDIIKEEEKIIEIKRREVKLEDKKRIEIKRIEEKKEIIRRIDGRKVNNLNEERNDERKDDIGKELKRMLDRRKEENDWEWSIRILKDEKSNLGKEEKKKLREGNEEKKIIRIDVEMIEEKENKLEGNKKNLDEEKIIGGEEVFKEMKKERILRKIEEDGEGNMRGRVGRIIKELMIKRIGDEEIGKERMKKGEKIGIIDLKNEVEERNEEKKGILKRNGEEGKRSERKERKEKDGIVMEIEKKMRKMLESLRKKKKKRKLKVRSKKVGIEKENGIESIKKKLERKDEEKIRENLIEKMKKERVRLRNDE